MLIILLSSNKRNESFFKVDVKTYDSIIFEDVLNRLCNTVYHCDYFFEFIGNVVFIEVVKVNNFIGEFRVRFLDHDTGEQKCVYSVVIEPKFEVQPQKYDLAGIEEPYAAYPPKKKSQKVSKYEKDKG